MLLDCLVKSELFGQDGHDDFFSFSQEVFFFECELCPLHSLIQVSNIQKGVICLNSVLSKGFQQGIFFSVEIAIPSV